MKVTKPAKIEVFIALAFAGMVIGIIIITLIFVKPLGYENRGEVFNALDTKQILSGLVVSVYDGDTITISEGEKGTEHKIRLAGIDAPERSQPSGKLAGWYLSNLLKGRSVDVFYKEKDWYGRIVGVVYFPGLSNTRYSGASVNSNLIAAGYAWHYRQYDNDQLFAFLEEKAKSAKAGLWGNPDPQPPWEYRKQR